MKIEEDVALGRYTTFGSGGPARGFARARSEEDVTAALAWGILCDLEGLTMTALLPVWTHDVKTLARALELRGTMLKKS